MKNIKYQFDHEKFVIKKIVVVGNWGASGGFRAHDADKPATETYQIFRFWNSFEECGAYFAGAIRSYRDLDNRYRAETDEELARLKIRKAQLAARHRNMIKLCKQLNIDQLPKEAPHARRRSRRPR